MGFKNETVTGLEDLVTKIDAYLVSRGWTSDELDTVTGEWGISRDTIFAQARWEKPVVASPSMGLYHSLGFISTATLPGNHTDDSGNGAISGSNGTIALQRRLFVGATPSQYWCFDSNSSPHYAHIVVQLDSTTVGHFGFGIIDKVGDWTGGEYCYAERTNPASTSVAIQATSTYLLDGLCQDQTPVVNMEEIAATLHLESFPNQVGGGSGKWGIPMGNQADANFGTDRASVARQRLIGGFRGSMLARAFGDFQSTPTDGLVPMYPIGCWFEDTTNVTVSAPVIMLLGWMQDVRGVSIKDFVIGDSVMVGGDEWFLFPSQKKGNTGSLTNTTAHQGIAYRKI